jgi:hypothetical protein
MRFLTGTIFAMLLVGTPASAWAQSQVGAAEVVQPSLAGTAARQPMQVPDVFVNDDLCPDGGPEDVQICSVRNRPAAVRALHRLAECLIVSQRTSSERAVWQYMSTGDLAGFRKVLAFGGRCRGGTIQASPVLFGGALAEALMTRVDVRRPVEPRPATFNCLITRQPEAASRLMRTEPWSRPEHAQMAEIIAVLPQCVPKDILLKTSKRLLRAGVALELFRASHRPPANLIEPTPTGTVTVSTLPQPEAPLRPLTPNAAATLPLPLPTIGFAQPAPATPRRDKPRMTPIIPEETRRADALMPMVDPNTGEAPTDRPRGRLPSTSDPF